MRILQINTTVNSGSTGRIAENIGKVLINEGHESYIAYGRGNNRSQSHLIKIGSKWSVLRHGMKSFLFDRHGFGSKRATIDFVADIQRLKPDVIGLHNLHGYFLNIDVLFQYLLESGIPVIWTFHDCWPFTGHCSFFDYVGCEKWKTHCKKCPLTQRYPRSAWTDSSFHNYEDKRAIFCGLPNLTIITPSQWLANLLPHSFLSAYPVKIIHNGIDLNLFRLLQDKNIPAEKLILGVANNWDRRKGLFDFVALRDELPADYQIVLIGLNQQQIKGLPEGIRGVQQTENIEELVQWYNRATVFVNPTYVDNFPTTNLEALACGTPVITYRTGGSPESIDSRTGFLVEKGNIRGLKEAIEQVFFNGKAYYQAFSRTRAIKFYNMNDRYHDYLKVYEQMGEEN